MELALTMLVPFLLLGVALWGLVRKVDVYDALITGAAEGLGVLIKIVPALVALLTAVYMLRASGALELAAQALAPVLGWLGIPPETVGLLLIRPVSGSAALGVGSSSLLMGRTPPSGAPPPSCWGPPRPPSIPSRCISARRGSSRPGTLSRPPCAPIWRGLRRRPGRCGYVLGDSARGSACRLLVPACRKNLCYTEKNKR